MLNNFAKVGNFCETGNFTLFWIPGTKAWLYYRKAEKERPAEIQRFGKAVASVASVPGEIQQLGLACCKV